MKKLVAFIKKKWVRLLTYLFLLLLAFLFFLCWPRYILKNYTDVISIALGEDIKKEIEICYGNIFNCQLVDFTINGEFDNNKVGDYDVTLAFGKEERKIKIVVMDVTSPIINVIGDDFVYCPNGKLPSIEYTAVDNYDGDITDKVEIKITDEGLLFKVQDSSSNEAEVLKKAKALDNEAPTLSLHGSLESYLLIGSNYSELGAEANDNCEGDLSDKIVINGEILNDSVGDYKISYSVTDTSLNTTTKERIVHVYKGNGDKYVPGKTIYLTFDDGPSVYTSKLLDVLKKYNIKATFFVTSQNLTLGHEDMIKRAYQEGHSIGLHSYTHDYSQIYQSVDNYFQDLNAISDKVFQITGYKSMLVRFPGGSSNLISRNNDGGTKIMTKLAKELHDRGYHYFDWNVSSGDAGGTSEKDGVFRNVTSALSGMDSYVVLQHDIKGFSVDAVEDIINYGLQRGFTFLPLKMDTPEVHHRIGN